LLRSILFIGEHVETPLHISPLEPVTDHHQETNIIWKLRTGLRVDAYDGTALDVVQRRWVLRRYLEHKTRVHTVYLKKAALTRCDDRENTSVIILIIRESSSSDPSVI